MTSAAPSIKAQKEAFVSGHEGTTPWEVLLVCLSAPVSLACLELIPNTNDKRFSLLIEAVMVWFPMVLCQTKFLYPYGVGVLGIQTLLVLLSWARRTRTSTTCYTATTATTTVSYKRLHYLTAYRSSILYLTFIAILAVDFHVFPRRFAKTEVYGYGLMDVGAASFCMSAGLVTPKARGNKVNFEWKKHALHTFPLVLLGIIRIWTNKGLEYQEHVTEYGVHWNFFFTMGALALVPPFIPFTVPTWMLPVGILAVYQVALSLSGLQDYIETAPRNCESDTASMLCHVFAANREGILGCLGYLSLYFTGECIGYNYLWTITTTASSSKNYGLLVLSAILWGLWFVLTQIGGLPVSRRSTNAPFCVWAAAHNVLLLSALQLTTTQERVPVVWDTVNRHGLLMFLIANLLTGLVNLTVPTLDIPDLLALVIVFDYICVVGIAALLLDWIFGRLRERKSKVA
jgi:phosphatidylinositol glycan class W